MLRTPHAATAWLGEQQIATSDDVVHVEGNAYFPATAVRPGLLEPTSTRTVCPWKGIAHYWTLTVADAVAPDAAWSYPHPSPLARRIKGRIAFSGVVEVRAVTRARAAERAGDES